MVKSALNKIMQLLCLACLTGALIVALAPATAVNAQNSGGLTVGPDLIIDSVESGSSSGYLLTVNSSLPTSLAVTGLGQTIAGAPIAVPAQSDTSSFSARAWINVGNTQLAAGNNQTVPVVINVPPGTDPGQRYAAILVQSQGSNSAIMVPIILTVDETSFVPSPSGQITGLSVPAVYQSKPLHILTSFSNTGNCLITRAQDTVIIKNSTGAVVWQNNALIADPSVMPGYPRMIDTVDAAGLSAGSYSFTSQITLATGQVYNMASNFTVLQPIPPPATPTLTAPGSGAAPGPVTSNLAPTFQWNAVPGADSYELSISAAPYDAAHTIYDKPNLTGTSWVLPSGTIWGAQEYCWTLVASNVYGQSSPAAFYFQTYGTAIRATTLDATNITPTGATLNANVLSLGTDASVSVSFEYGGTTGYGTTTSPVVKNTTGAVNIPVAGLTPNTTYHFAVYVAGSSNALGADDIFTTPDQVPTIANITPASAGAGASVTISGRNFDNSTTVSFNNTPSTNVSITGNTSLTATVPNLGTSNINNVTVKVTNSGGSATSISFNYIGITQAPTISAISPSSVAMGAKVTITGTNFVSGTTVSFNGILSPGVSVVNNTTLTATVPGLGTSSISNVTVVATTGSGSATSTSFSYIYSAPPTVATNAGTNITSNGASLNGYLTGLGSAASVNVYFEYGTTASYGTSTAAQSLTAAGTFNAVVTGLAANTAYHFRADAVGASTVFGNDLTFTTADVSPTPTATVSATPTPSSTPAASLIPTASNTPANSATPQALTQPAIRSYAGYFPPVMAESNIVHLDFTNQAAPYFDASGGTGTEIGLTGTSNRGAIVVGKYLDQPQTQAQFSSGPIKGGTGKPWIKFVGVRIEGSTRGTALVTIHYTPDEISNFDPNSLFLAYYSGNKWIKCQNIKISPDSNSISGEIPVVILTGTAVGLGGNQVQSANGIPYIAQSNGGAAGPGVSWSLVGVMIASIIIVGGVVFVVERNRRKTPANSQP